MKLDNEGQRRTLLEMFDNTQFAGKFVELAFTLKRAIKTAELEPPAEQE